VSDVIPLAGSRNSPTLEVGPGVFEFMLSLDLTLNPIKEPTDL